MMKSVGKDVFKLKTQNMKGRSFFTNFNPSLDIVNKPVRPLSFTISSRLLYQGKVKMKLSSNTMYKMLLNWHRSKEHSR